MYQATAVWPPVQASGRLWVPALAGTTNNPMKILEFADVCMPQRLRGATIPRRHYSLQLRKLSIRPESRNAVLPADFLIEKREVVGGWLVSLALAAVCFGLPTLTVLP
jgi:hypothetical protein